MKTQLIINKIPSTSVVPIELSQEQALSGIWTCGYEQACKDIKRILFENKIDEIINQLDIVKTRIELERKKQGGNAVFMLNAQYESICDALSKIKEGE